MDSVSVAIITVALIALLAGLGLSYASRRLPSDQGSLAETVNELLPQTQCAQCGYPGCRPYAEAIVNGAAINLCPPGGDATVRRLAELLGRDVLPLVEAPPEQRQVAIIDEAICIGCTHCITACPVDAIVGAQNMMHTVIKQECTGCELCIAPVPGRLHSPRGCLMTEAAPTYDLGKLHGGLRLEAHKAESTQLPIQDLPVPAQLVLPIDQHAGDAAQPVVGIGEQVLKGQLIAEPYGSLGAPVHAPTSARSSRLNPGPSPSVMARRHPASSSKAMARIAPWRPGKNRCPTGR